MRRPRFEIRTLMFAVAVMATGLAIVQDPAILLVVALADGLVIALGTGRLDRFRHDVDLEPGGEPAARGPLSGDDSGRRGGD